MQIFLLILAGIVGGIIGGMGMGGGTLLIPILTIFLDVPQKNAQAINLVAFIPMAIIVTIINIKRKGIDYKSVLMVATPALITSIISALLVKKISSKALSVGFAVFLIILGVIMMIDTLRKCIYAYMNKCKEVYTVND
ncbi:MAG: sulfite exporter TauE/SafE family protein [Clostridia bacterium]|nr:sulfite exporter TauE/SafE family protein [Clostridia bacterium]